MSVFILSVATLGTAGVVAGLYFLAVERRRAAKAAKRLAHRQQEDARRAHA
jgi:Flp pilus assembly protein TadB